MAIYRRGSRGEGVRRIQQRLNELGFDAGTPDGIFGAGTERAVKAFQQSRGLSPDGIAGPNTETALFADEGGAAAEAASSPLDGRSLPFRVLSLTGSFETSRPVPECFSGVAGNFDGQGISFGALQWNLGQGSLQPILKRMAGEAPAVLAQVFGDDLDELMAMLGQSKQSQLAWADGIQDSRHRIQEPWLSRFRELGAQQACQQAQKQEASKYYNVARDWSARYGLESERAAALMFDIRVQNGSISDTVRRQIEGDYAAIDTSAPWEEREVARLRIVANRRAEASNPRWVEDVRNRKLTIANGRGTVHGRSYNLASQYGIRLKKV